MEYTIIKASAKEDAIKANVFLTKLIHDEKNYDKNINENCTINSFYEKIYKDDNNCLLLLKTKEKYIGYLYGYIINNNAYLKTVAQLDAIFIEKPYRGNGLSKKLINEFKKWSKEKHACFIELKVCNKNNVAMELYKNMDFKETKTIMTCSLEDE